nr:paramyosin isoform X1 [Tanacetum cinerariifolium]
MFMFSASIWTTEEAIRRAKALKEDEGIGTFRSGYLMSLYAKKQIKFYQRFVVAACSERDNATTKNQLTDLQATELSKSLYAKKQIKFYQRFVVAACSERDNATTKAKQAKENNPPGILDKLIGTSPITDLDTT